MRILSISNVIQCANLVCAQLNLQFDRENTQSVSPKFASKMVSQTVSSLYLSNAECGTLLWNDKLYDQAYRFALVTSYEQQLIVLNTYIYDFQSVADELAGTDLFKKLVYYLRKNSIFQFN